MAIVMVMNRLGVITIKVAFAIIAALTASKKMVDLKKILGQREILGHNKFWVWKNVWSEKFAGPIKILVQKNLGPKNFGAKRFWFQKNGGPKKYFGPKEILGPKKCCIRKQFLVRIEFMGPKNFGVEKILDPKILGAK